MYRIIIIYIQFLIFISFAFSSKQINKKLPVNYIPADTIIWKYYNQDEKLLYTDKLALSSYSPGLGIDGPGTLSFAFDTDDYFGGLEFTIKTIHHNKWY